MLAEARNVQTQYNLGNCYFNGVGIAVKKRQADKGWKRAADQKHSDSMFNLGNSYANGEGIAVNKVESFKWYKRG